MFLCLYMVSFYLTHMNKLFILILSMTSIVYLSSCKSDNNKTEKDQHSSQIHSHDGDHEHTNDVKEKALQSHEGHEHEHSATGHTHDHVSAEHKNETGHVQEEDSHSHDQDTGHEHSDDCGKKQEEDAHAGHDHGEEDTELSIHYHSKVLKTKPFHFVIKTSGEIVPDQKDELLIVAKTSGMVQFSDHFLYPGVELKATDKLFTICSKFLLENNIDVKLKQAKADFNEAENQFNRSKELIKEQLISEKEFQEVQSVYLKSQAEFENLNRFRAENGEQVFSGQDAYVKEIFVKEGQFVNAGDKLLSLVIPHMFVLKAQVAPNYLSHLQEIQSANFRTSYDNKLYELKNLGGKMISVGRSMAENSFYIPVYFKFKHQKEIIPGTFAEIFLIGKEIEDALLVPNTAILEEFGNYYVYEEVHEGEFEKRYIKKGMSNGSETQVLEGIRAGSNIVVEGAYQVKLAQMKTLPAHDHAH